MRARRSSALTIACLAAAALTGCSGGTTTGTPTTPSSAPSSAGGGLPTDGAPTVQNPIQNTSAAETNPCSSASNSEVASLNVTVSNTRTEDMSPGQSCVWVLNDSAGVISGGLNVGNKLGLSSLYRQHSQGQLAVFTPLQPVDGYPAVAYNRITASQGTCQLAVGVRDDLTYTVIAQLRSGNPYLNNPCDLSSKLAGIAISHLKGA
ncbi:DUF3558 family protein [Amycolatopsis rhabdoformis]|uniref:DUF3558 family protein n=1 Tax=Amycolatopsis rhabdoformis TaxID=1448059 RepID=A0ABZ1I2R9_9PSEU|nr:DUF3558 family protein [Amycolatopsis rhabdoformis]WSE28236.1 DUF3558 family protein [Amycolatopsis rhabdoformis]